MNGFDISAVMQQEQPDLIVSFGTWRNILPHERLREDRKKERNKGRKKEQTKDKQKEIK